MLRLERSTQHILEHYPFVVRMATKHGTKTWFENPALQRLTSRQFLLAQSALSAEFFPFDTSENQSVGEVITTNPLIETKTQGMLWWKNDITLPVTIGAVLGEVERADYRATCISYESRRMHSSGGSVALRGIVPEDVVLLLTESMCTPVRRRHIFEIATGASKMAPIFTPDFAAIDEAGLTFRLADEA